MVLTKVEETKKKNIHMKEYLKEVLILMRDMYHLKVKVIHYLAQAAILVQLHQIIDKDCQVMV